MRGAGTCWVKEQRKNKMSHFVYVLASRPYGAIYVGAARDLRHRVEQHRSNAISSHTRKYNIKTLVWFEMHETLAAGMERQIDRRDKSAVARCLFGYSFVKFAGRVIFRAYTNGIGIFPNPYPASNRVLAQIVERPPIKSGEV